MQQHNTILLRIAIAFAFLYPPFDAISNPSIWIGFFPRFLLGHVPDTTLLIGWAIVEIIIALWILSGKHIFLPSLVATVLLLSIVFFNFSLLDIVFRDLALALVTATLAWWSWEEGREKRKI